MLIYCCCYSCISCNTAVRLHIKEMLIDEVQKSLFQYLPSEVPWIRFEYLFMKQSNQICHVKNKSDLQYLI